jgi:hypothetical protein
MATETPTPAITLVRYHVSEAQIADFRAKCVDLTTDTPEGYEQVRLAIASLRDTRTSIEKRRVELKADALAYGRLVDSEAKRYTGLLLEIEEPLKVKKAVVDDEKARLKAEADRIKLEALEAEIRANREKQEAEQRAAREAEEARLATERAALERERAALAAERLEVEARQRAQQEAVRIERDALEAAQRAERAKLDEERQALAREREQAERAEFERQARIQAEADAKAKAEREELERLEREARIQAVLPDARKLEAYGAALLAVPLPLLRTKMAKHVLSLAMTDLQAIANAVTGLERKVA